MTIADDRATSNNRAKLSKRIFGTGAALCPRCFRCRTGGFAQVHVIFRNDGTAIESARTVVMDFARTKARSFLYYKIREVTVGFLLLNR